MNVLILTPDRVGSTLLQRLITVYMAAHEYDRPVINLHELTNGLMRYYSPVFNQEVLGKPNDRPWGYYQSLTEITEMLHSVDHYKTSRLAQYHIKNRQDPMSQQVPFYNYLNDNFFIISAQRDNLLEHALSWGIYTQTGTLNVYDARDKLFTFADLYRNKFTLQQETLTKYLNQYVEYLRWVDDHFKVSSYFHYDRDLVRIEEYILSLPIFNNQSKKSWKDIFQIEFDDWNRCHYLSSDMSGLSKQLPSHQKQQMKLEFTGVPSENPVEYQLELKENLNSVFNGLSKIDQQFMIAHADNYRNTQTAINELMDNKVLVTGVPIKLQTLLEKKLLISNFDQCVEWYNNWVETNGVGQRYSQQQLLEQSEKELNQWHSAPLLSATDQQTPGQSADHNGDGRGQNLLGLPRQ